MNVSMKINKIFEFKSETTNQSHSIWNKKLQI